MTNHAHLWKRSPVTDFTVTYECECGSRHRMQWCSLIPSVCEVDAKLSVCEVDAKLTGAYGGTGNTQNLTSATGTQPGTPGYLNPYA